MQAIHLTLVFVVTKSVIKILISNNHLYCNLVINYTYFVYMDRKVTSCLDSNSVRSLLVIILFCISISIIGTVGVTAVEAQPANGINELSGDLSYDELSLQNDTDSSNRAHVNKSELPYEDRIQYNDNLQANGSWGPPAPINGTAKTVQTKRTNGANGSGSASYDFQTGEVTRQDSAETAVRSDRVLSERGSITEQFQQEKVIGNDDRDRIQSTSLFPWSSIVELQITADNGARYTCSGSIISENGNNYHALTAGHCVYLHDNGGWADSITVIPAADSNNKPFHEAQVVSARTYDSGWIQDEDPKFDFALLTLDRSIGNFTGAMGYGYEGEDNDIYSHSSTHVAGYPGDKPPSTMWHDSDTGMGTIGSFGSSDKIHKYEMDTAGGMSGGPVWVEDYFGNGNTYQLTVHTYASNNDYNFGTRINQNKFNDVQGWIDQDETNYPPNNKPDLVDDGAEWSVFTPTTVASGHTFTVSSDVRNIGTAQSGCFNVTYYASNDTTITPAHDHEIGSTTSCNIEPFTSKNAEFEGSFPSTVPDETYYVGWAVDSNNDVTEFSESNNKAINTSMTLTVDSLSAVYPPNSTVSQYDGNGNGQIEQNELVDGLVAYSNDQISQSELIDILKAYSDS